MFNIILTFLFILVLSRFIGEALERRRLPVMVGEIAVGMMLGPPALGLIQPGPEFDIIIDLALFFIVFTTGLEFSIGKMKRDLFKSACISIMANNVAFFTGIFMSLLLGYGILESLFIGAVFSLTALPVAMRILTDLGINKTRFGKIVITSSIIDDLFSIVLLSFILPLATASESDPRTAMILLLKMAFFLGFAFTVNSLFMWKNELASSYIMKGMKKLHSKGAEFTVFLLVGFGFAFLGEVTGVTFIIGAFYGGALIGEKLVGREVYRDVTSIFNVITFGFFSPLFFAYIGMRFLPLEHWLGLSPHGFVMFLVLVGTFLTFALVGKAGGAYIGARLSGLGSRTATAIGAAMNSRGLMGIVIAGLGYTMGIVDDMTFSLLILVSILTTLMTPFILGRLLRNDPCIQNLEGMPGDPDLGMDCEMFGIDMD